MRYLFVATAFIALLAAGSATFVQGAGLVAVGREGCDCSPLVARGIVPDTVNKLHLAVYFPEMAGAVERFAEEFRTVFSNVIGPKAVAAEATPVSVEAEKTTEEAPAVKKEAAPEPAKKAKKPKQTKRLKRPPIAK